MKDKQYIVSYWYWRRRLWSLYVYLFI